jgi:hypothetical protein
VDSGGLWNCGLLPQEAGPSRRDAQSDRVWGDVLPHQTIYPSGRHHPILHSNISEQQRRRCYRPDNSVATAAGEDFSEIAESLVDLLSACSRSSTTATKSYGT